MLKFMLSILSLVKILLDNAGVKKDVNELANDIQIVRIKEN